MRVHNNTKLYGGEFLNNVEDLFSVKEDKHIIDTWKVLINYKNYDKFGYWDQYSLTNKKRLENLLWRKWYMKTQDINKICFDMEFIPRSILNGRLVLLD